MRLLMGAITIHEPRDIVQQQALPVLQQLSIPLHVLQLFDAFIRAVIDDNNYDSNN
jgi:hypothetical protein